MATASEDIVVIEGRKDLLLVAPHGHRKDDEDTGELTLKAAQLLGCRAIVNRVFRKPRGQRPDVDEMRLNLNKCDQAALHPWYLKAIRETVDAAEKALVIWMHGIKDENIRAEAVQSAAFDGDPDRLLVLAGFGQGRSNKTGQSHDRFTACPETTSGLIDSLSTCGLTAIATRRRAFSYRGRHEDYMNQWFVGNRYPLSRVESVQLEFKYTGVRDDRSRDAAAEAFARALAGLR